MQYAYVVTIDYAPWWEVYAVALGEDDRLLAVAGPLTRAEVEGRLPHELLAQPAYWELRSDDELQECSRYLREHQTLVLTESQIIDRGLSVTDILERYYEDV